MLIPIYNTDEYESVYEGDTCDYHKRNPYDKSYPGCACFSSWSYKRKDRDKNEELRLKEKRKKELLDYIYAHN